MLNEKFDKSDLTEQALRELRNAPRAHVTFAALNYTKPRPGAPVFTSIRAPISYFDDASKPPESTGPGSISRGEVRYPDYRQLAAVNPVEYIQTVVDDPLAENGRRVIRADFPLSSKDITLLQTAIMLRAADPWRYLPIEVVLAACLYAERCGMDILRGDIYLVNGKPSISDTARIAHMRKQNTLSSVSVTPITKAEHPFTGKADFYCEAEITDTRYTKPETYRAWLSEWYNEKNLHWKNSTEDSLQRKALARLSTRVYPLGIDSEDVVTDGRRTLSEVRDIASEIVASTRPDQTVSNPETKIQKTE